MLEKINLVSSSCLGDIAKAENLASLQNAKVKYLGKSGEFTQLLKMLKDVSPQDKPLMGKNLNDARVKLEQSFEDKEKILNFLVLSHKIETESIDITINKQTKRVGSLHPITLVSNEIIDIFTGLGFSILEGPEVETDYYNFQALNIPADHPARDAQDTFYVTDSILLRTHTSPNQVRVMEKSQPPIKMLCPGRVYRSDDDATHSPIFHQIEGLVIDKNITLCDLKGTLEEFAKKIFNAETRVRLRPSFFPFTEPSVEVDLSCSNCNGKGCRLCKGTGWIEVLGAGMVNPFVLENSGIDSTVYSGFAFGLGVERMAIIKYGIPDIRLFYENDVRFLKQFK